MVLRFQGSCNYCWSFKDWIDYMNGVNNVVLNHSGSTTLRLEDECLIFRLHHTDILIQSPFNNFKYDAGYYHTLTTKHRMNCFGPVYIYQKNYEWYYDVPGSSDRMIYDNGMILNTYGERVKELWSI